MLRDILRRYGIEDVTPRRVTAGNNNEHWFAGKYVLRRYRDRRPFDTVVFEHAVLDHLGDLGWPVPVPIAARGGERVLEAGGRLYALFPRLPGRRGIAERPRNPRSLGRMLARLHRDLATCRYDAPETVFAPVLSVSSTWGTATHSVEELLHAYAEESPQHAAYCLEALSRVRAEAAGAGADRMRRTLIHGDWHAGNLLYTRGEVTGVLDFDFAHPDLRVADLAISGMVVDMDTAVELIDGYQEVEALPPDELGLLNLYERARILGAVAATLSIRTRGGKVNAGPGVLVPMLRGLDERWPVMRSRLGLP